MRMKLKALVITLAIAALAGCASNGKKPLTQKEAAVQQWNQARAAVLASLAKSQFEAGHLDKSAQTTGEALRLEPNNASLHVMNARILVEQGQLEQADAELTLARQFDPKNAEADYYSGIVYQRWQKPQQAFEAYSRASEKQPNELQYILAKAETLVAMGKAVDALALLKSQDQRFEHNPVLHHMIGQLQVDQGQYAEAVESLRQASVLAPDDLGVREHLAMAYLYNKQPREATDIFARLLKEDSQARRPELWIALGQCQLQTNRVSDARNSFDKATQLDASSAVAWRNLAKATLELGDTRRAEIVLRKAMAIQSENAECHLMLGYIRLRQERLSDALVEFQSASLLDRNDTLSLCMIGHVLEKQGKQSEAMKYYARALKIEPNDKLATKLMASVGTDEQ